MSLRSDMWDEEVTEYWSAVRKGHPLFYVNKEEDGEEVGYAFDTFTEAKKFAKKNRIEKIFVDSFEYATRRNASYPDDYDEYGIVCVDLNREVLEWNMDIVLEEG